MRTVSVWLAGVLSTVCVASICQADDGAKKKEELVARVAKEIEASKASDKVKEFAKKALLPLCTHEVLVKETVALNAKKVALDEIKKIDKEWSAAEEELPIQAEKLNNTCAKELKKIIAGNSAIVEAFAMDNQGAVVGENALTSDYWQGDEEKWTGSYNGGKGGVDVGKEKFDKSANATLQQISLPLIDAQGEVIGAVTWGLSVDKL